MIPPEPLDEPAPTAAPGGHLSAEQLRRHLVARVRTARERVQVLEAQRPAPAVLVTRVGATVAEAQRVIDLERAEADVRAEALGRVVARRAGELLAEAEAEARVLRAVATWLRQVPAGVFVPQLPTEGGAIAAPVVVAAPVLAALEARAS
jgi:hypothetical protein